MSSLFKKFIFYILFFIWFGLAFTASLSLPKMIGVVFLPSEELGSNYFALTFINIFMSSLFAYIGSKFVVYGRLGKIKKSVKAKLKG